MKALEVFVLSCFVPVSIFIHSTDSQHIRLGNSYGNTHGSSRTIGGYSDVAQDLKQGQNCQIGSYCKIASGCLMGDNVHVGNYVNIEHGSSIGTNCQIMDYAKVGPYVAMGPNNLINAYAKIEESAEIGTGCMMSMYSTVGPHAKLERNVYAGNYCKIGSNSVIRENAVIQPYATVPDNGQVGPNEMIIKTPTTSELYQNCLPMNQIPQSDVDLADQGTPENLNERVRQLMSSQKQEMRTSCQQNTQSVNFKPLKLVISLYLIRYDGLDQFIQNKEQGLGLGNTGGEIISLGNFGISEIFINGRRVSVQAGGSDQHFVEGSPKKVLEPELENDMVELLALKEDSQRTNRVPGDTFCKTVSEIQSKQRKVKCDQSVDLTSPNQSGSKNGEGHRQPPNPGRRNDNNSQKNADSYQPNRELHPLPQPQQGYPNGPNTPNIRPTRPTTMRNYETTNGPSYSMNSIIPNNRNPNQTNNRENNQQPRPWYGYPNNTPTTLNSYEPTPTVNREIQRPTSTPTYSNNRTLNNNEPERRPNRNPPIGGYPNAPQSPYTPSNNNQPNRPPNKQGFYLNTPWQPTDSSPPECNQCNIKSDTTFGHNVELGDNLNIGESTTIGNNCKIKSNAVIGRNVKIANDSIVFENANVGNDCVLEDKSKVGPNANIGTGSYVGKNCEIGANAFIGENSIVLDNAKVPDNGYFGSDQVVMPIPTSADLYSSCAPVENVTQHLMSQQDPNVNLRQMMRAQIAKMGSYCQQSQQVLNFAGLASAKSIYLISLHGLQSFSSNRQNAIHKSNGNGNYDSKAYEKLMNEEHFVENGQPSSIEPDVKGEMIILLAIEQDFHRGNRAPGDTFCQTFMDIASNKRHVKCDK